MLYRNIVRRIDTEDQRKVRDKNLATLNSHMTAAVTDEETGLPAWIVAAGIQPADGGPLM